MLHIFNLKFLNREFKTLMISGQQLIRVQEPYYSVKGKHIVKFGHIVCIEIGLVRGSGSFQVDPGQKIVSLSACRKAIIICSMLYDFLNLIEIPSRVICFKWCGFKLRPTSRETC